MRRSELAATIGFEDGTTEEEAEQHTRDLVLLLEDLQVEEVRACGGQAPAGTRSADPATLAGAVLVTGVLLKPVLSAVVSLLGTWLEQSGQKSVTVEVEGAKVTVTGRVPAGEVEGYVRALRAENTASGSNPAPDPVSGSAAAGAGA